MHTTAAVTFTVIGVVLFAAHSVADHVTGQSDWMAANKAAVGRLGWRAVLAHVAVYHLTLCAAVAGAVAAFRLPTSPAGAVAALAVSVLTHTVLDRRWPLISIMKWTRCSAFAELRLPIAGAPEPAGWYPGRYAADQALHTGALCLSAAIFALL
jgi:hypothetical protein